MYTKVIYDLGSVKEIQKYIPGNYGAPGCPREKKRKRTPEEIQKQNQRNKIRKVQRLILKNFTEGDLHLVLTYKKELRPESIEEANKQRAKFFTDLRRVYKRAGPELKYIAATEKGSKGAVHHHIIINNPEGINLTRTIQKIWPYGQQYTTPLYEEGEYEDLAAYLVKDETKEEVAGTSYTRSRNLIIPEPQREKIFHRRWKEEPQIPKGWELIKGTLQNGLNPVTGHPYQHYMIRRTYESKYLCISDHKRPKKAAGVRNRSSGSRDRKRTGNKNSANAGRRLREWCESQGLK